MSKVDKKLEEEFKEFILKVINTFNQFIEEYKKKPDKINKQIKDFVENRESIKGEKKTTQRIVVEDFVTYFEMDSFGEDIHIGILVSNFTRSIIKSKEFEEMKQKISSLVPKQFEVKTRFIEFPVRDPAEYYILNFFEVLLRKLLLAKDSFTPELLDEYITIFFKEIQKLELEFTTFNHLAGIELDIDELKLNNELTIKKGVHEDYTVLEKFGYFKKKIAIKKPGVLLKLIKHTNNENELLEIENISIKILQLFRLSNVFPFERHRYFKTAIFPSDLHKQTFQITKPLFQAYKLTNKNKDEFKDFFGSFFEPVKVVLSDEVKYRNIIFAIERYLWALYDFVRLDRKIMFAVMGLEVLFSVDGEFGASRNLTFRIPKFLGYYGYNIEKVKNNIHKAYKKRNKVVHGLKYNKNWIKETEILLPKILNYLRISIIHYLFNLSMTKKELVKLIDDSFLYEEKNAVLFEQISNYSRKFPNVFAEKIPKEFEPFQAKLIVGNKANQKEIPDNKTTTYTYKDGEMVDNDEESEKKK